MKKQRSLQRIDSFGELKWHGPTLFALLIAGILFGGTAAVIAVCIVLINASMKFILKRRIKLIICFQNASVRIKNKTSSTTIISSFADSGSDSGFILREEGETCILDCSTLRLLVHSFGDNVVSPANRYVI